MDFGFPCPIPAVLNRFFLFLLDCLSLLPDVTSYLFMSELNQEHIVHVCMVFESSIEVFFGVHVDNLKYFHFLDSA